MKEKLLNHLIKYPVLFYALYFLYTIRPSLRLLIFSSDKLESLLHYGLIGWGVVIVGYNIIYRKDILSKENRKFIYCWIVLSILTVVSNISVITVDSIKSVVLTILSLLYFLTGYPILKEKYSNLEIFKKIFYPVLTLKLLINVISIYLYLTNSSIFVVKGDILEFLGVRYVWVVGNSYTPLLYGLYKDPNFTAMMGITLVLTAAYIYALGKPKIKIPETIFIFTSIVLEFLIVAFSNSRGALYSVLATGIFVILTFTLRKYIKERRLGIKNIVYGCLMLVTVFISYDVIQRAGFALSQNSDFNRSIYVDKDNKFERISEDELVQARYEKHRSWILEYEVPVDSSGNSRKNNKAVAVVVEKQDSGEELGNGRLAIWKDTVTLFTKRAIFGIGPEMQKKLSNEEYSDLDIPSMKEGRSIHNSYLAVLLYYGSIGVLLIAVWMGSIFIFKLKDEIDRGYTPESILFYGVIFTLLVSLFLESIFVNIDFQQIWLMFVIGAITYSKEEKDVTVG